VRKAPLTKTICRPVPAALAPARLRTETEQGPKEFRRFGKVRFLFAPNSRSLSAGRSIPLRYGSPGSQSTFRSSRTTLRSANLGATLTPMRRRFPVRAPGSRGQAVSSSLGLETRQLAQGFSSRGEWAPGFS